MKKAIRDGTYQITTESSSPTLSEYSLEFLRHYRVKNKPSTVKRIELVLKKYVLPLFGKKHLTHITSRDIEHYKALRFEQKAKPATINLELMLLSAMFSDASHYTKINPVKGITLLKTNNARVRWLTDDEEKRLFASKKLYPKAKNAVIIAMNTRLRIGEVLGLTTNDVDFANKLSRIRAETSKSSGTRFIPINKKAMAVLVELKDSGKESTGKLFDFKSTDTLRLTFWRTCKDAKVEDFHFHDLRHTFASRLAMAGVPLVTIKELMGCIT
jgi:integrase